MTSYTEITTAPIHVLWESEAHPGGQEGRSMKRKHTPDQIISKLREAETDRASGMSIAQVLQETVVSRVLRTF